MKRLCTLLMLVPALCGLRAQEIAVPETQRALVVKHTATWCPPCGQQAWETFETLLNEYEDEAIFLQAHRSSSSLFYSPNAQPLFSNADASFGQPEFFFNTTRIGSGSGSTATQLGMNILAAATAKPVAQTGIAFRYDPAGRMVSVDTRTRFFQAANGDFFLSVFLVIRDTTGFQETRGPGQIHKRVLRQALTTNTFGEQILGGSAVAGSEKTYSVSARLPDDVGIKKVQIVTVLWRRTAGGKYEVVNANLQNEFSELTTSREELSALRAGFSVSPTVVVTDLNVRFDLPRAFPQAELTLFNLLGQPVATLHRGALPAGEQTLRFQRPAGVRQGLYLLRLAAGKDVATRRVFIQ